MAKFIKDFKSFCKGIALFLFSGASIAAAATCMNYGVAIGSAIYVVVGVMDLLFAGYAAFSFFKKYFM